MFRHCIVYDIIKTSDSVTERYLSVSRNCGEESKAGLVPIGWNGVQSLLVSFM